jgi:hypothetical protein
MSNSHTLHPRWLPLLKIEISSNGQNCFILSQNVPKFEQWFQRRRILKKFTDGRQVTAIAHTGELKKIGQFSYNLINIIFSNMYVP